MNMWVASAVIAWDERLKFQNLLCCKGEHKSLLSTTEHMGRESTTEQSLGVNKAELVVWAYLGTHKISN